MTKHRKLTSEKQAQKEEKRSMIRNINKLICLLAQSGYDFLPNKHIYLIRIGRQTYLGEFLT
jgi:hypothetical protein